MVGTEERWEGGSQGGIVTSVAGREDVRQRRKEGQGRRKRGRKEDRDGGPLGDWEGPLDNIGPLS